MKEKRMGIILFILLLSLILFMMVCPSISAIVQDISREFALRQTVFLLIFSFICFQFTEIILFTHKLE